MHKLLWHAPISSAERRAESADSCELKSFLQRDSDLRARWAPGRLAWQEHQEWLKQASCLFLSQDTFCPMLSCGQLHFFFVWNYITSFAFLNFIGMSSEVVVQKNGKSFKPMVSTCTQVHISISHHSWTWPDLHYQPSSSSRSHTSHPSHLSFLFSFCKHTVLSSLLWMELLWSFNC